MAKRRFTFDLSVRVMVTLDESLLPDDGWRSTFYPLHTLEDVAEHIAYNAAANRITDITNLDGFADRRKSDADITVTWLDEVERIYPRKS